MTGKVCKPKFWCGGKIRRIFKLEGNYSGATHFIQPKVAKLAAPQMSEVRRTCGVEGD